MDRWARRSKPRRRPRDRLPKLAKGSQARSNPHSRTKRRKVRVRPDFSNQHYRSKRRRDRQRQVCSSKASRNSSGQGATTTGLQQAQQGINAGIAQNQIGNTLAGQNQVIQGNVAIAGQQIGALGNYNATAAGMQGNINSANVGLANNQYAGPAGDAWWGAEWGWRCDECCWQWWCARRYGQDNGRWRRNDVIRGYRRKRSCSRRACGAGGACWTGRHRTGRRCRTARQCSSIDWAAEFSWPISSGSNGHRPIRPSVPIGSRQPEHAKLDRQYAEPSSARYGLWKPDALSGNVERRKRRNEDGKHGSYGRLPWGSRRFGRPCRCKVAGSEGDQVRQFVLERQGSRIAE